VLGDNNEQIGSLYIEEEFNLTKTGGIPYSCGSGTSSHYTEAAVQSPDGLIKQYSDQTEASESAQDGKGHINTDELSTGLHIKVINSKLL
jgi:hypothetical protein